MPETHELLTEDEIEFAWNRGMGDPVLTSWQSLDKDMRDTIVRVCRRLPIVTAARESDAAARIAAQREALVHLMSEMRKGPSMRWAAEDVESFTDDEYPLPPRECVRQCERCGGSEGPMESTRGGPFTHSVIEDCIEHLTSEVKKLKFFAAGVGR